LETDEFSGVTLQPGQSAVFPIRLSLRSDPRVLSQFEDVEGAWKTYSIVDASSPDEVFADAYDSSVVKRGDSFLPPQRPPLDDYIYGPEIELSRIDLDGRSMTLPKAPVNEIELMAGEGYGSCPFLYVYDNKSWVKRGKVLAGANAVGNTATETSEFQGFKSRYRIAEEEFEITFLERAFLEVGLADGRTITIKNEIEGLREVDGNTVTITPMQHVDLNFALPSGIERDDVVFSKLVLTGHYRRYSSMPILAKPSPPTGVTMWDSNRPRFPIGD
jgi:hypothetical protein